MCVFSHRITDAAFDFSACPFESFVGCLSLESISLQVTSIFMKALELCFDSTLDSCSGMSANYWRGCRYSEQKLPATYSFKFESVQECESSADPANFLSSQSSCPQFGFH